MAEGYTIRRCLHFYSRIEKCRAGVVVNAMVDDDGRLPCLVIRGITGTVSCDEIEMEPLPAAEAEGSLTKAFEMLLNGRCPDCGDAMRGQLEMEGVIYATPCHHVLREKQEPLVRVRKPESKPKPAKPEPPPSPPKLKLVP